MIVNDRIDPPFKLYMRFATGIDLINYEKNLTTRGYMSTVKISSEDQNIQIAYNILIEKIKKIVKTNLAIGFKTLLEQMLKFDEFTAQSHTDLLFDLIEFGIIHGEMHPNSAIVPEAMDRRMLLYPVIRYETTIINDDLIPGLTRYLITQTNYRIKKNIEMLAERGVQKKLIFQDGNIETL